MSGRTDMTRFSHLSPPENALARIWFWNQAGAQSFICPAREVRDHYRRLTADGCIVWHTEIREP